MSQITGAHYGESHSKDVSLRVITDHIRSATFMICDGVLPSNEGRGYVLRRLLRRAARHGKLLGVDHPFLYEVCDTVIHENEGHYPELRERQDYITKVIRVEEENFAKTIDGGLKIFGEMLEGHKARGEKTFSGADAFKLYDTYGFPIDLTIEMVEDEGMELDKAAFDTLMEEQKTRARKAREALGDLGWAGVEFGKDMPATQFLGYESHSAQGKVLALVAGEELREELGTGAEGILVLDQTPFYAEMGGQVQAYKALGVGTVFSFLGTIFGILILVFVSPIIANFALKFGPAEYFSVSVFALTLIASLAGKSLIKGLISAALGIMFITVGAAPIDAVSRYTFDSFRHPPRDRSPDRRPDR